ncbi:MAG: hypothetical protein GX682_04030 [Clostridiaceae bacterium]|nr:hypothetical protein [Clostridiaceae bacterium]
MEYTKDIILNIRVKKLNGMKLKMQKASNTLKGIIVNNKMVILVITLLLGLMIIDFVLINNFISLFSRLY